MDVVFVARFHQIVRFSMKSSDIKIFLRGNVIRELKQPQRRRKYRFNK